jgi:hypothetical protein
MSENQIIEELKHGAIIVKVLPDESDENTVHQLEMGDNHLVITGVEFNKLRKKRVIQYAGTDKENSNNLIYIYNETE